MIRKLALALVFAAIIIATGMAVTVMAEPASACQVMLSCG